MMPSNHAGILTCSFSPPTSDSQEISLKNNLSCDGMCGMIGISQASGVCSIEVRPMGGRRRFVGLLQFDKTQRTAGPCCPCLYLGKSAFRNQSRNADLTKYINIANARVVQRIFELEREFCQHLVLPITTNASV